MWRSNYQEDWERRKTYLIRSLFQDIPVLSPVPEYPESRSGAGSPSDIPPSRSHSPLPPLIIERMPNRHDHSKKFYQELEVKMKKLYKKLFHNKGSSSIEDLLEIYGGDCDNFSSIDQNQDHCEDIGAEIASVTTVKLCENTSQCNGSETISQDHTTSSKDITKSLAVGSTASRKTRSSSCSEGSKDIQSSTHSICQTQITTVVEVHKEPLSDQDETPSVHHEIQNVSPVLECHRIGYNKTLGQIEIYHEKEIEKPENDDNNEIGETDAFGFPKQCNSTEEQLDQDSSSEISHKSIEVMRRQKEISLSLGSMHNEPVASSSSRHSSPYKNFQFQRIISLPEKNVSSEDPINSTVTSFSSASADFDNVLTTSTPKLKNKGTRSSSKSSSTTVKRVRSESSDTEDNFSIRITKRKKFENMAIQTSLISESDADDNIDWNQLKNKFFVGIPRIYKLCPCIDHACKEN